MRLFFLGINSEDALNLFVNRANDLSVTWEILDSVCAILNGENKEVFAKELQAFYGNKILYGENLESIALSLLKQKNLKLAVGESCSGGLLSYHFTRLSGASEVFLGGVVSYANEIKEKILKVDKDSLNTFGAVSEEVVKQMLNGVLNEFGADVAIASSGIAGPNNDGSLKPVGYVFVGVAFRGNPPVIELHNFKGDRESIQKQTCQSAILLMLKNMLTLSSNF